MPLKDKETPKPMEQALEIMNELTGWDTGDKQKSMPLKGRKRNKK